FGTTLDDTESVASCVLKAQRCALEEIYDAENPRVRELILLLGADVAAFPCLPDRGGDGDGTGEPDGTGTAVTECARTITSVAARLARAQLTARARCAHAVFRCDQLRPDSVGCHTRAQILCAFQLGRVAD